MRRFLLLTLMVSSAFVSRSGNTIDSLVSIIKSNADDSVKIMAYVLLTQNYFNQQGKAIELLNEMNDFCEMKIKSQRLKALCLRKIGVTYGNLNYFDKALEFTFKSADLFETLSDKQGLANCYNNIGSFYNSKGDFTKDELFYKRSIEYHLKAIQLRKEIHDTVQIQNSYNNIGGAYLSVEDYHKALEYYNMAYAKYQRTGDGNAMEIINTNLGECYFKIGLNEKNKIYFKKALHYFLIVLKAYNPNNPTERLASAFTSVGQIYVEMGNNSLGISYLQKGLEMAQTLKDKGGIMDAAKKLSDAYERTGDYKKSLELMHVYDANKDSLINAKNSTSIEEMQALYQTTQKDREIDKLNSEKIIKDAELSRQRTIIISTIGAVLSILILVLVLWSRFNLKKKANLELGEAYRKIELKNQQITDSINYSKRIQNAILPPVDHICEQLKNFFIYYAPKDIVSGDFYWYAEHLNRLYFIVVDCTGHGVPGALMSMIGNTLLNEIINQKNVSEPGEILTHLNKGVKNALRQSNTDLISQDDGMDVSICCIDKENPTILHYACANHSIFIKSNNKVTELVGDIYSIGGDFGSFEKQFENKTFSLDKDSFVVMSTDGYYDQFGGEKDKKFLITQFEEFILNTDLTAKDVAEKLNTTLLNWKGIKKQTDDILVAGFKV